MRSVATSGWFSPNAAAVQHARPFQQGRGVVQVAQLVRQAAKVAQVVGQRRIVRSQFALQRLHAAFQIGARGAQVGKRGDRRWRHAECLDL